MLPLRFDDIVAADIVNLVDLKIAEHKTLEYKQKLSIDTGDERAEFLADISSFANAAGGDIVFGVSDERDATGKATGVPKSIVGLKIGNPESERGKIEQLIESGIQPRIPVVHVKVFDIFARGSVIVIRVGKSWIAPHMVSYANRSRFFSRNSSVGKVQLDVQQIGAAFALQRTLGERLRTWKALRIGKAISREDPFSGDGSILLFHFVSVTALTEGEHSLPRIFENPQNWGNAYRLMSLSAEYSRYNADGLLLSSRKTDDNAWSYLQIFRDGSLEYGDSYALHTYGREQIVSKILEQKIVETFAGALQLQRLLNVAEPLFVAITLLGVRGKRMAVPQVFTHWRSASEPFDRDVVLCSDVLLRNASEGSPYPTTLLPLIDSIWQAAGLPRSPYIDQNNVWNPF